MRRGQCTIVPQDEDDHDHHGEDDHDDDDHLDHDGGEDENFDPTNDSRLNAALLIRDHCDTSLLVKS